MANVSAISKNNSSYIMSYFINIETVRETASQLDKIANEKIGNWITSLESQIDDGGLDQYALNIGGDPILNTNAVRLVNELKQRQTMLANVKTEIINIAKKHRNAELRKLEEELIKKRNEKEAKIESLRQQAQKAKEDLSERPGWDINIFVGSYKTQIKDCNDAIENIGKQLRTIRADECYSYVGGE